MLQLGPLVNILCLAFLPGWGHADSGEQPGRITEGPQHFKIGFLAPWNGTFSDFSALTSASAISIAIERVNTDPTLNGKMKFRSETTGFSL